MCVYIHVQARICIHRCSSNDFVKVLTDVMLNMAVVY